eukprot:GHVS01029195.1.p1 GENE.GHVS01029195.1~~GHVS01029195.1.p1  ORF type:complete len:309 (+),score=42.51 GHVS01029195.1:260-1186(+)
MGLTNVLHRLLGDAVQWRALHTQTKDQVKPELVLALACDLWAESHSIAAPTSVGEFQRSLLERLRLLGTVSFPCYPVFTLTSLIAVLCSRVSTFVLDRVEVCLDITESITDIMLPPRKMSVSAPPDKPNGHGEKKVHEEVAERLIAPSRSLSRKSPANPPRPSAIPGTRRMLKSDLSYDRSKGYCPSPPPPSCVEPTAALEEGGPAIENSESASGKCTAKCVGGSAAAGGGASAEAGFVHLLVCWVMTWFAPTGRVERAMRIVKRMIFLPWKVWRQAWQFARTASEKVSQQTALLKQVWRWRVLAYRR